MTSLPSMKEFEISPKWIAFDEASKIDDIILNKISSFGPVEKKNPMDITYTTTIDYASIEKRIVDQIDSKLIYKTMQQIMEKTLYEEYRPEKKICNCPQCRGSGEGVSQPKFKAWEMFKSPRDWTQNKFEYGKARCLVGMLMAKWDLIGDPETERNPGYTSNLRRLAEFIGRREYGPSYYSHRPARELAHWNDTPGRRFEEIVEVLKACDI